ncbi:Serine-rich protein-related [Heracleum sosnowskyi]|uniref:Serine-rich protein-related n=1 Tax=Heracleum sosnowskyi TaxID=360622 RepID=A0AAD8N7V7_9APIA|nr:Serine-rich protein-related [Heracleum sosnowskyi]
MAASSRRYNGPVLRSQSPSGKFCSSFASSSSSAFSSKFIRSTSPTRVNLNGLSNSMSSVRFSLDRAGSPRRSISATSRNQVVKKTSTNIPMRSQKKRTCMCSPTNHPGSFRCSLHKNTSNNAPSGSYPTNRLNARRSAMTNSLVRIGTVEGDLVKRALAALIRPSSHSQKRRGSFQPRPSRLSVMSVAEQGPLVTVV